MQDTVDKGWPGSLTVLFLCIAVAFLLRSFYKRYKAMSARSDENTSDN